MQVCLPVQADPFRIQGMPQSTMTFRDLIEAAAKPHRELWKTDGNLNLGALARFYERMGHPVSEASFSRIFAGKQGLGDDTVEATHHVFRIPRSILRGEPLSADMENLLARSRISTLMLAERLESLPKDDYFMICQQIERAESNVAKLKEALENSNVTQLRRPKTT